MQAIDTMIIPAAGYGTRMLKITCGSSKELLEIGNKPALMYALEEGVKANIKRAGIIIRKGKEDIIHAVRHDHRLSGIRKQLHIDFFYQHTATGEVGAIVMAEKWIGDLPFVVHYPDNISEISGILDRLVNRFWEIQGDLVLLTSMLNHVQARPCGLCSLGNGLYQLQSDRVPTEFPYGLRPTGIYVATPAFLAACKKAISKLQSQEIKDQDIRRQMIACSIPVYGQDFSMHVFDTGNPAGYQLARSKFHGNG